jgi:YggT family protein
MLMSWVPLLIRGFEPRGVLAVVFEAVYTVTDPPIKFFDRLVPPVGFGNVGFSVVFIIVFVLLAILQRVVIVIFW